MAAFFPGTTACACFLLIAALIRQPIVLAPKGIREDEPADGRVMRKLLTYEALYLFFLGVITQADHRGWLPVSTTGQQDIIGTGRCVRSAQRSF